MATTSSIASSAPPGGENTEPLRGVIDRILFRNEENGYTVCAVQIDGRQEPAIVVGICAAIWVGEHMQAEGRWLRHKQHGFQFQAEKIECLAPASLEGIRRYLGSGRIKGIGPVMAQRMVKAFGDRTLNIIEKESARLLEVPGIGAKRRDQIKSSWNEQKSVRDIMIFLHGHGVGAAHAMRIYRIYGPQAIALVTQNAYRLIDDIWGIGFKTADRIALSVGVPSQSEIRARAGVLYVLGTLADEGHCYCPRTELVTTAEELLAIPMAIIESAIDNAILQKTIIAEDGHLYLARLHQAEMEVAGHIRRLLQTPTRFPPIQVAKAVAWAEKRMGLTFDPAQAAALAMALSNKLSIITGGPGVGKTTIIRALVDIFRTRRLAVVLAAPTGRAAKRLEEATGTKAQTIHRLLKVQPGTGQFEHGPSKPIEADVCVLDEVSMMDVMLMHTMLGALRSNACLVLVGDTDQLPSVGPGNVLRDCIDSGALPATRLERIFRQQSQSWIVLNAHHINHGEFLDLPPKEAADTADFFFIETEEPDDVIKRLVTLLTERIPNKFGFKPRTDIQVLTPMRRNQLGAENLNNILQEKLNPIGPTVERFGRKYRVHDRVLQVRNNYDKDVFNGDIGIIAGVDAENQEVLVHFDGRHVRYDFVELDELDLAYACSIHKSQGSEYPAVIVLLATQHYKLLQRNLLYTAITRGRQLVCLIGSTKAIQIAIHNNRVGMRRTGLKERLRALSAAMPAAE